MHDQLLSQTGGLPGLRDEGLLESALNAPFQGFGEVSVYPSLPQKAARLGYGLVKNHPFADGNKRIGAHAMLVLLAINGTELVYTQEELSPPYWRCLFSLFSPQHFLTHILTHTGIRSV